ncbi:surface-adhesin E family protein [Trinickia soli]|uniref:surface-adhesin E family protein n=1 Tax=Trinickia soli TaxID=380675 RepID=UPI003FA34C04
MFRRLRAVSAIASGIVCCACVSTGPAPEWSSYNSSTYGMLLANQGSLVKSNDSAHVWIAHGPMKLNPGQAVYTKELYAIDCREHAYQLLQVVGYDRHGQAANIPVEPGVRNVVPDSMQQVIEQFACKPANGWWTPVVRVPETLEKRIQSANEGFFD